MSWPLEKNEPFDLITLDIMMPVKDGHTTLKEIRQIEQNEYGISVMDGIKVIMISALRDRKNIMGSFREGCEAYVTKPFNKETLLNEVKKLGFPV